MNGYKFTKALELLNKYFSLKKQDKFYLLHSIRVGEYLKKSGYSEDIQVSGLLHNVLDDTDISENIIFNDFGEHVLNIIKANSRNNDLKNPEQIIEDIFRKCSIVGEDAFIVKIVDIYDNFLFYLRKNDNFGIERCKKLSKILKKYKKEEWNDKIFNIIDEIIRHN